MEQSEKEKQQFETGFKSHQQKMIEIKQKLKESEEKANAEELTELKSELSEMEKQEKEWKEKEEELKKKERLTPWNIDTLCHEGKSKTIINKTKVEKDLTEEEKAERQVEHSQKNEKLMKKFGMMQRFQDSQAFLLEHPELVCEETANYLVIWCINLETEEKHDLMRHVSHQTIVMQFILELARSLKIDPRACVKPFFTRINLNEDQYLAAFNDELESFRERIRVRAKARLEEAIKEVEEEQKQERLGPGGLDPVEVFETLPKEMQECFEEKDIGKLQEIISKMDLKDAEYHMKRCVDSGLWVPNAKDNEEQTAADGSPSGD